MRVDTKKFFIALIVFFAVVIGMGIREYNDAKSNSLQSIREELSKATTSASVITGSHYYDKLLTSQISPVDLATINEDITLLTQSHNMKNIYTVYKDANNTVRYGANTSLDDKYIQAMEPAKNNGADLAKILNSKLPYFQLDPQNGYHTLYLPGVTSSGIHYLNIAITKSISLQKISQTAIFDTVAKSLLLFLGIFPFLILYRNVLSSTADRLNEEVDQTHEKLHETTTLLHDRVEEKTKELINEGFIDSLTHLPNRHRLLFDMDRNSYDALIVIHLQNLHDLNRYFGPSVCDSLRQQFALLLVKSNLNAYRLGRDEFALLVDQKHKDGELDYFSKYLLELFSTHSFNAFNENITMSVRLGIDASEHLNLGNADEALFEANRSSEAYSIFKENKELQKEQNQHIANASSIREAYYDGRIICYYQPIVSTKTGKVLLYETLARLIDKNSTIILPLDFLAIAKKTALYPEISREVIRQTCEAFSSREESFTLHLCALDVVNHHTIRYIEEMVVSTNTSEQVIFELSESDIYDNYLQVIQFITTMKRLGVRISIDNFGSDSSSLEKMIDLDIDFIKIDGGIINKIVQNKKYLDVTRSIVELAKALEAKTIAENVEDDDTFALLQSINIDYVQGFYIGKPSHLP
jgi:EAL domain-containing protein (putative c-di-GMP-specific phosphodiesterase class I)/GGDEF domain-containing protein